VFSSFLTLNCQFSSLLRNFHLQFKFCKLNFGEGKIAIHNSASKSRNETYLQLSRCGTSSLFFSNEFKLCLSYDERIADDEKVERTLLLAHTKKLQENLFVVDK
jgi:hypothetical protein